MVTIDKPVLLRLFLECWYRLLNAAFSSPCTFFTSIIYGFNVGHG
ncbi:unknow [Vibrio parahaemolyticus]|nr:unknow [Vibrio parahaemolyticus]